jgi:hypothetical protein
LGKIILNTKTDYILDQDGMTHFEIEFRHVCGPIPLEPVKELKSEICTLLWKHERQDKE